MPALRSWNAAAFGCLTRENAHVTSRGRTALTVSLPTPTVSRKADTSACIEMEFGIDVTNAGWAAWQQWTSFDLLDCSLPFTIYIPWGEVQPQVRARLLGGWSASRIDSMRWQIGGLMEIERSSLPPFSGGAYG
jgi:hypothetical protein